MPIGNCGGFGPVMSGGQTIFNDTSSAAGASIGNGGSGLWVPRAVEQSSTTHRLPTTPPSATTELGESHGVGGQTIFNGTSTAANASIDNWEAVVTA